VMPIRQCTLAANPTQCESKAALLMLDLRNVQEASFF